MDDASKDDNNSSLAPDTRADRSLPPEPAPQVTFVSGDMGPLLCVACGSPIGGDETESTATVACPCCRQHYRMVRFWKLYKAMISIDDLPLRRVEVRAQSLDDANEKLEAEYGKGTVINLHNPQDAQKPR